MNLIGIVFIQPYMTIGKNTKTGIENFRDSGMPLSLYFILYTLYFSYEVVA